ncbi:hypothetical protein DBV15_01458 [Temnothorax longispinosus]|uniref:Uncharacterized protein n=1 Tax=Temnothorax longispinosus TaxID=300112 RepID=A0A4S2KUV1_9HYME|nr:hypothetical protein DBV15_01458 [Temnothorax longispinosus]
MDTPLGLSDTHRPVLHVMTSQSDLSVAEIVAKFWSLQIETVSTSISCHVLLPARENVIFVAIAVPLEDPLNSISLSYFFEANYALPPNITYLEPWTEVKRRKRNIERTTIYRVLESKFERQVCKQITARYENALRVFRKGVSAESNLRDLGVPAPTQRVDRRHHALRVLRDTRDCREMLSRPNWSAAMKAAPSTNRSAHWDSST